MPGCQVVFNRPVEEALRALEEAAQKLGGAEVLSGDISIAVMGPSIASVTNVLEEALKGMLADGTAVVCTLSLSEG